MRITFWLGLLWLALCSVAAAQEITLDFDTPATGLNIVTTPLSTSAGTITASASGNSAILLSTGGGFGGNALRHDQSADTDFAQLAFDFDVDSVSFLYAGFQGGSFTGEVLDGSFTVLDSYFDGDTGDDLPGGPVTLSGVGIRYFRFNDAPLGGLFSGVDEVRIVPTIPEPATAALAVISLSLTTLRRNRCKKSNRILAPPRSRVSSVLPCDNRG